MKQKKMVEQLRLIAGNYDGISQDLFQTAQMLEISDQYHLQNKMMSIDRIAETTTVQLREMAARLAEKNGGTFYDEVAHLMGIGVKERKYWLEIQVPAVLPNRNTRDSQTFLIRPFRSALVEFQKNTPIERFQSCAICIVHTYDEALGIRRVRDYDNVETKRYLDVIESVFLTNDSGLFCTVLQTTKISDQDTTTFYLMRPESLSLWTEKHVKSIPNCGSNLNP